MTETGMSRQERYRAAILLGVVIAAALTLIALVEHVVWGKDIQFVYTMAIGGFGGVLLSAVVWGYVTYYGGKGE